MDFFQNDRSKLPTTWLELGESYPESFLVVLCLVKILILAALLNFWSKYIACGDKMMLLTVFGYFLPICWCFMAMFCFLSNSYDIFMAHFWLLFWSKNCLFLLKIKVFAIFSCVRSFVFQVLMFLWFSEFVCRRETTSHFLFL